MVNKQLGDMLLRRYVVDFIANMQKLTLPPHKLVFNKHPWYITNQGVFHLHFHNTLFQCQINESNPRCLTCGIAIPKRISALAFYTGLRKLEEPILHTSYNLKDIT